MTVPAVESDTTPQTGVSTSQPALFPSPRDPAAALAAIRSAATAPVSARARLLFAAACAEYGITGQWLSADQLAVPLQISSHAVRPLLGELTRIGLLTARRMVVDQRDGDGRRVARHRYQLVGGAR